MTVQTNPRFQKAIEKAVADWAVADPVRCADLAGCATTAGGVLVPFFGQRHLVSHPAGRVESAEQGKPAHVSIAILLLHYLLTADAAPAADRWATFRELPGGLFYAQAFAAHAEAPLAAFVADTAGAGDGDTAGAGDGDALGHRISELRAAAGRLGGADLDLADAAVRFQALPRVPVAVLLWKGDEEFPGQAGILFDASAHHYLPTEDLAGMGDWLAHQLVRGR